MPRVRPARCSSGEELRPPATEIREAVLWGEDADRALGGPAHHAECTRNWAAAVRTVARMRQASTETGSKMVNVDPIPSRLSTRKCP